MSCSVGFFPYRIAYLWECECISGTYYELSDHPISQNTSEVSEYAEWNDHPDMLAGKPHKRQSY